MNKNYKTHLSKLEKALAQIKPKKKHPKAPNFCHPDYTPNLKMLNLSVPEVRGFYKEMKLEWQNRDDLVKLFLYLWQETQLFEVRSCCLEYLSEQNKKESIIPYWSLIKNLVKTVDNWAHSDSLSSLIASLHEEKPELVYPILLKWNNSKNPWEVRQSMVGLLYYSSFRKEVPKLNKMLPLVRKHLDHSDYYVQKAVGWSLREIGNVYPRETYKFLEANIKNLSTYAFSAACEKISAEDKLRLKKIRVS